MYKFMDHYFTVSEVATKLNLSDKTLRRWEDAGRFEASRTLGNQRRYSLEDLQILDAIKHGVIPDQKDLLTLHQAAQLAGVSPATIDRWEREGKIHPFITVGSTFYPKHRLLEKLSSLRSEPKDVPVPEMPYTPVVEPSAPVKPPTPHLTPLVIPTTHADRIHNAYLVLLGNFFLTVGLIALYHLLVVLPSAVPPTTPTATGQVQGATTDPRIDLLERKLGEHITEEALIRSQLATPPAPTASASATPTSSPSVRLENSTFLR